MTAVKPDITQQRAYFRRARRYRTAGGYYRQRMHSSFSMTAAKPHIAQCWTIIGYCAKILLTSFQSLLRCAAVVRLHQQ